MTRQQNVPVEIARYAFLVTLCRRIAGPHVARSYIEEKVREIYRCQTAIEVRGLLDATSQLIFDDVVSKSKAVWGLPTWPDVHLTTLGEPG